MQTYFYQLADWLGTRLQSGEQYLAWLSAEESDFIRFNHSKVRQATSVRQIALTLGLISQRRRADIKVMLSGQREQDEAQLNQVLDILRADVAQLPEDPYLLVSETVQSSERQAKASLPSTDEVIDQVTRAGAGVDLVGLYAGGKLYRGFANSLGQRNWHSADNFNFEWCLYHAKDKAVKSSYAGAEWNASEYSQRMDFARTQLARLGDAPMTLKPGQYRAYLSPSALKEVLDMLCWGGFGIKSQKTKQSCLQKMIEDDARLSPMVSIRENTGNGLSSAFQQEGFIKPGRVDLIDDGALKGSLISPRSAQEYQLPTNGANLWETPESLDMAGGALKRSDALKALDTGLLIGNLWYLNFSDRTACRMTGMTRFATFWVENGEIKAPLNVMRFDDTVFRMLGSNLEALTADPELLPSADSYGERSVQSTRLPGALIRDFALTL
jgi:predicted Zn-dependent protease